MKPVIALVLLKRLLDICLGKDKKANLRLIRMTGSGLEAGIRYKTGENQVGSAYSRTPLISGTLRPVFACGFNIHSNYPSQIEEWLKLGLGFQM